MIKTFIFFTAIGLSSLAPTAFAVTADDHDRDHRYYDRDHKDYHEWNDREDRAWHKYWEQRHRPYVSWDRARESERARYWAWRHHHSDSILHIDIR